MGIGLVGQSAFFGGLGKLVAAWPWITIVLCVLLTGLLCGLGVLRFAVEDDPFELYVPSSTRATYDHEKVVEEKFGPLPVQVNIASMGVKGVSTLHAPDSFVMDGNVFVGCVFGYGSVGENWGYLCRTGA